MAQTVACNLARRTFDFACLVFSREGTTSTTLIKDNGIGIPEEDLSFEFLIRDLPNGRKYAIYRYGSLSRYELCNKMGLLAVSSTIGKVQPSLRSTSLLRIYSRSSYSSSVWGSLPTGKVCWLKRLNPQWIKCLSRLIVFPDTQPYTFLSLSLRGQGSFDPRCALCSERIYRRSISSESSRWPSVCLVTCIELQVASHLVFYQQNRNTSLAASSRTSFLCCRASQYNLPNHLRLSQCVQMSLCWVAECAQISCVMAPIETWTSIMLISFRLTICISRSRESTYRRDASDQVNLAYLVN